MSAPETTRRGALVALAGAAAFAGTVGTAIAAPPEAPEAESADGDRRYDAGYDEGFAVAAEAFAFVWLEHYTALGGDVYYDTINGCFRMGRPCYSLSPCAREFTILRRRVRKRAWFRALPRKRRHANEREARREAQNFWEGKIMALQDLLAGHTEGQEAVKRIVRAVPSLGFPRKVEG